MNKLVLLFVFIILFIVRISLENTTLLLLAVTGISLVGFLIVLFQVADALFRKILKKITKDILVSKVAKREKSRIYKIIIVVSLLLGAISLLIGLISPSNLKNDLISIMTICISVLDDEITGFFTNLYKCGSGK